MGSKVMRPLMSRACRYALSCQVSSSHLDLRTVRRCRPEPTRFGLVQVSEWSKAVPLDLDSV